MMSVVKINPYIAISLGVVAVSFSSLFVKLSHAHPIIIAFYRLFFTFIILLPFTWKEKNRGFSAISFHDALLSILSGAFLGFHLVSWFLSLQYTSVASSVVLVTIQPVFVMLGSYWFFREKVGSKALIGGLLALIGSLMIGFGDFQFGGRALLGDFLALLGAVTVSGYLIIGRHMRTRINLLVYTFLVYGTSCLLVGLIALFSAKRFYPYSLRDWGLFLALAFICTVCGHTVFSWALRYVKASVIAVGILGEPVGAIIWAWVFLGQQPSQMQLVSAAIILLGLYIFTTAGIGEGKKDSL